MDSEKINTAQQEAPKTAPEIIQEIPKESPKQFTSEYLDKKIDELVEQRLKEREDSYRQKIEDAQRLIEEAEERRALEEQLEKSEKYSKLESVREHKEREFKEALIMLREMARREMYPANMYKEYDTHQGRAARGDRRSIDMLGYMKLIDLSMRYTPDQALKMLKTNIGVIEAVE